ncbi:uncharacterized protein EI90DRAFT_3053339 [Cantharellus anzutake]|uniref:uncharacterized protein n=1 Tax=Cantharellus anzutake TaxID=1750568 RepID=UPI001906E3DB|nr:uncharacterized protein EI90DRAFT_3053339 [Cantharellus anzutake]KAF8333201.1 hypothetical protein EI90DRAFT_3053339 [Cantharellus anzutake]
MLEYHATDAPPLSARLGTFKFAGQPRSENGVNGTGAPTKRRGHHHKHSVSHNFFSFMEPGQTQEEPSPESPFPSQDSTPHFSPGTSERRSSLRPLPMSHKRSPSVHLLSRYLDNPEQTTALIFFAAETVLGSSLWIAGQSRGSLACTGLGYWIVFDSLGVALSSAFPSLWSLSAQEVDLQRPFGTRRLETTVSFAQSIYLIFSAVYVLKEAVEHFLLSSEGEAAHPHHNHSIGISFPAFLLWLSLASLLLSNFAYRNHSRLVDAVGSSLPHPSTVFASIPFLRRSARVVLSSLNSSPLVSRILSNPFTLAPTTFVLLLLYASYFADKSQQMTIDMLVSSIETVWTFSIAYPSAVSLGKILLQTAPERTLSGGSLESFQRAIREIRRDPRILEVLDTHLWQLTLPRSSSLSSSDAEELVASVEVHVQEDASDMDILEITRWASDKISIALGKPRVGSVTVSVVRG